MSIMNLTAKLNLTLASRNRSFFGCNLLIAIASAAAAITAFPAISAAPEKASRAGYILEMTTVGQDRYKVHVTPQAIRVDIINAGTTVVSKAPKWDVVAYRKDQQRVLHVSKDDWRTKYKLRKMSWAGELKEPTSTVKGTYKGLPTVRCNFPPTDIVGLYFQSKVEPSNEYNEFNQPYVVCLMIENGSESGAALARLHGLPALPGLPIEVKRKRKKGNIETTIDITGLARADIPSSVFDIPASYKPATFREAFFLSPTQTENAKELFDQFLH